MLNLRLLEITDEQKSGFTQKSFYNTHLELNSHLKLSETKVFTPPLEIVKLIFSIETIERQNRGVKT